MKRDSHDFEATERKHRDRIMMDLCPNGGLLIQIGLNRGRELEWNSIRLEPRQTKRLKRLLRKVEVYSTWGHDTKVDQVIRQGAEDALSKVRKRRGMHEEEEP